MSDSSRRIFSGWTIAIVLFALLVLYPLSIGPAFRLCYHHRAGAFPDEGVIAAVVTAYAPVIWAFKTSDRSLNALNWYIQLWLPRESYIQFFP